MASAAIYTLFLPGVIAPYRSSRLNEDKNVVYQVFQNLSTVGSLKTSDGFSVKSVFSTQFLKISLRNQALHISLSHPELTIFRQCNRPGKFVVSASHHHHQNELITKIIKQLSSTLTRTRSESRRHLSARERRRTNR